jgi:hypothetical protein
MTKWIREPRGMSLRSEKFNTTVRTHMKEALKRYAKSEGIYISDVIDTKLMNDRRLRSFLQAVEKEQHDQTTDRISTGGRQA